MKLDRNVLAAVAITALATTLVIYRRPAPELPAAAQATITKHLAPARTTIDPLRSESVSLTASSGPHRNIFTFEEPPVVQVAPVKRAVITQAPPPVVVTPVQAAHNDVPVPPAFPYHCIGRFGPDKAPFVALTNDAHEIVNVRAGETIGGQFIIRSIGVESVDVGFTGFPASADKRIAIGH